MWSESGGDRDTLTNYELGVGVDRLGIRIDRHRQGVGRLRVRHFLGVGVSIRPLRWTISLLIHTQ